LINKELHDFVFQTPLWTSADVELHPTHSSSAIGRLPRDRKLLTIVILV